MLRKWLSANGCKCEALDFPDYGTPIGREIKRFLLGRSDHPPQVRHMLFAANRWEKAEELIRRLDYGEVLVIDRYTESNLAYGTANGLKLRWLTNLENGLPKSDITIILDAPPDELYSRRKRKDSYEANLKLQEQAKAAYRKLAKRFGWFLVPAIGAPTEIHASILELVVPRLRAKRLI